MKNIENHRTTLMVHFSDQVDTITFEVEGSGPDTQWRSTKHSSTSVRKSLDSNKSIGYSGIHGFSAPHGARMPAKSGRSSARSAVARALSLAALLGLPACTSADMQCGKLIADTGCGKDMVGKNTFSNAFLDTNSWQRERPMRMQTANGIVELDREVSFDIQSLQQTAKRDSWP